MVALATCHAGIGSARLEPSRFASTKQSKGVLGGNLTTGLHERPRMHLEIGKLVASCHLFRTDDRKDSNRLVGVFFLVMIARAIFVLSLFSGGAQRPVPRDKHVLEVLSFRLLACLFCSRRLKYIITFMSITMRTFGVHYCWAFASHVVGRVVVSPSCPLFRALLCY